MRHTGVIAGDNRDHMRIASNYDMQRRSRIATPIVANAPIVPEVTSSATVDSVRATRERRHRLLTRRARLRRIRLAQSRTPTTSYGLTTSGFEIRRRISAGARISGGDVTTLNEDNDGIRGGTISMVDPSYRTMA